MKYIEPANKELAIKHLRYLKANDQYCKIGDEIEVESDTFTFVRKNKSVVPKFIAAKYIIITPEIRELINNYVDN